MRSYIIIVVSTSFLLLTSLSIFTQLLQLGKSDPNTVNAIVGTANVIGAFGVLLAVVTLVFQAKESRIQRSYELTEKYRDQNFKMAERFVKYELNTYLSENNATLDLGLAELKKYSIKLEVPDTGQIVNWRLDNIVQKVSNFYNTVGLLAAYRIIDTDMFFANSGNDLLLSWLILEPIVRSQDRVRHNARDRLHLKHDLIWSKIPYQGGFKYLVDKFENDHASRAAERLISYSESIHTIEDLFSLKKAGFW